MTKQEQEAIRKTYEKHGAAIGWLECAELVDDRLETVNDLVRLVRDVEVNLHMRLAAAMEVCRLLR
jgi:hypothetical protein